MINNLSFVEKKIGYLFNNKQLLLQAFTRKSYSEENGGENNELLEFVGDMALEYSVLRVLIKNYSNYSFLSHDIEFHSELTEGKFTELKKKLVDKTMLASRIKILGFNQYLIMGNGDIKQNKNLEKSVMEDLFEAIIGAVTLDSNYDNEIIDMVVENMLDINYYLNNGFDTDDENYIGKIQEYYQARFKCLPIYEVKQERKSFYATLSLPLLSPKSFIATGKSMKEAKMASARLAYFELNLNK